MKSRPLTNNNDENFWILMSVLEIRAQAKFAGMAYNNIAEKPGTGDEWAVFSSIHSFLSHCTLISKMLKARGTKQSIGEVLEIPEDSIIHQRRFRNHLEHYDERLKSWIDKAGLGSSIVNHHIGNRKDFPIQDAIFVNFYDPFTKTFTFVDEDFDLEKLFKETKAIEKTASNWLGE
jgi:hypothetical protein